MAKLILPIMLLLVSLSSFAGEKEKTALHEGTKYCNSTYSNVFANRSSCLRGVHAGASFKGAMDFNSIYQVCLENVFGSYGTPTLVNGQQVKSLNSQCADGVAVGYGLAKD